MEDGRWRMEDGGWRMEDGGWWMKDGERRMGREDEGWKDGMDDEGWLNLTKGTPKKRKRRLCRDSNVNESYGKLFQLFPQNRKNLRARNSLDSVLQRHPA
jgi:hypothetical protein